MHHPTERIIHTTAYVTPVVEHWLEWEIAQWVHLKEYHELHLAPVKFELLAWWATENFRIWPALVNGLFIDIHL